MRSGGALLALIGFKGALLIMAGALALIWVSSFYYMSNAMGRLSAPCSLAGFIRLSGWGRVYGYPAFVIFAALISGALLRHTKAI